MSGVRLLASDGAELDPGQLHVEEMELHAGELAAVVQAATRAGRVLARDGFALRGLGEAAAIELPAGLGEKGAARAAAALLAALPAEGRTRAVALGALPFDPAAPARLTVPRLVVREEDGASRALVVLPAGERVDRGALLGALTAGNGHPTAPPERFHLAPAGSHASFRRRVAAALQEIESGRFDKVVLAREVTVHADRPFRPEHLVGRLRRLHPSCCTFSVDGVVGASPELLVRRRGEAVTSQPLAGTVGRSGDPDEDRRLAESLLASDKERAEHRYVVDAIRDALAPFSAALSVPETPHLMELRNVVHLATTIEGRLAADRAGCLELTAAVHPTPAVCGTPREAALQYLREEEHLRRDRYAGPVGYLDGDGDGEFWLAIRSAMIDGRDARLLAGVGIVAGSVPDDELAETQLKLQALLAAAVRP